MISIVICSRNKEMLAQVTSSVNETIGVPYEIIAVDNSTGKYGICAAYNLGANQSKYETLCFMHEDLKFHTQGWGQIVLDNLADVRAGVLGVAGGTYQPKAPMSWTGTGLANIRINVLHSTGTGAPTLAYHNPNDETVAETATVDGLWMCCPKEVWRQFSFDEDDFPHFHFYDIAFCTKVYCKYKVLVTFDILIEHFSTGTFGRDWSINALKYYKLRNELLPFGAARFSKEEEKAMELGGFQQAALRAIEFKQGFADFWYCLTKALSIDVFNRDTLWIIKQYLKQ